MPKRQTMYKVDSSEIQGEGSWAELSYITYGEFQAILKGTIKPNELLEKHVIAWNWVDDQDVSLPPPGECMDDLFSPEREFLLNCLYNPSEDNLKNSPTG